MRVSIAVVLIMAALVATSSCMKSDPLFCCLTAATCEEAGSDAIVTCSDPSRPYCDDTGQYAAPGTCIADPSTACDPDCTAEAPVCAEAGNTCGPCSAAADCAGYPGTPVCDAQGDGACVECVTPADCSGVDEVCRVDRTCGPCTADTECESEVCDEDAGVCADGANVVYLDPSGIDGATCSAEAPCRTFEHGLTLIGGARDTIKARSGEYTSTDGVVIDNSVIISAPEASLKRTSAGAVVEVTGSGTQARIVGLRIHEALGSTSGDAIKCADNAEIVLQRVTLEGSGRYGIQATDCAATVAQSTISGNAGGGLSLTSSSFELTNNVIVGNGSGTSGFGGVSLSQAVAGTRRFEFNTVAGNVAQGGFAAGVLCSSMTMPTAMASSIIYGNVNVPTGDPQVDGANCTWTYSVIGPDAETGTGNINADPLFVDTGNDDYHLMTTSPAKNAADPAAILALDFDGDARPSDGRSDIGADEITP